jgi:hypothetical protein
MPLIPATPCYKGSDDENLLHKMTINLIFTGWNPVGFAVRQSCNHSFF